jgi:uncharacterized coiled-coil protein SlyX
MDEVQIAYHEYRVLMIDQTDTDLESHWGIGNRAGLFVAMEMCLLQSGNSLRSPPSPELPSLNFVLPPALPSCSSPPPATPVPVMSSPLTPSQDDDSEADIDRIKLSSEVATQSLQLHLDQKKVESTNRLKQRLLERKQKRSQTVEAEEIPPHPPLSSPNLPPPVPPHLPASQHDTRSDYSDESLPLFIKQLIDFSPLLCPSFPQFQFLSLNLLAARLEQAPEERHGRDF